MKKLLAAVAALGLAGCLWFLLREGGREAEAPAATSEDPQREAQASFERIRAQLNSVRSAPLPPPQGSLSIRGRVLGASGPLPGALVIATRPEGDETLSELPCQCDNECGRKLLECGCGEAAAQLMQLVVERRGEAPPIVRARSGAEGFFELTGLEEGSYALWADAEADSAVVQQVAAGAQNAEILVSSGMALRGKVVNEKGAGIGGAVVTAIYAAHSRFFDALTGDDGAFALGPLPEGQYNLVAASGALLPAHQKVTPADRAEEVRLTLHAPRRIAGVVLAGREPLPAAQVSLEGQHRKAKVDADKQGTFHFAGLRPGDYELTAVAGGRLGAESVEIEPGTDVLDVEIVVGDAGEIVGTVTDGAKRPVPGATVSVRMSGAGVWKKAKTGTDGRYRLSPVQGGRGWIHVQAKGYASEDSIEYEIGGSGATVVHLTLRTAAPLAGAVVDPEGRPVANASIEARWPRPPEEQEDSLERWRGKADSARSDADGGFALTALDEGEYELRVTHSDFQPGRLKASAPSQGLRIALSQGATLSGEVVDERDRPVARAQVAASREGEDRFAEPKTSEPTDAAGAFKISGLEEGTWSVVAVSSAGDGHKSVKARVEVRGSAAQKIKLRLRETLSISGKVVDERGGPIPEVHLLAVPRRADGMGQLGFVDAFRLFDGAPKGLTARTGTDGAFLIKGLEEGEYLLQLSKKGYQEKAPGKRAAPFEGRRAKAGERGLRIVMIATGLVRGRVITSDGRPVTRYEINFEAVKDGDGKFELEAHRDGEMTLMVSAQGLASTERTVAVLKDRVTVVPDIVLVAGRALSGRVLDGETGAPVAGALVDVGSPPEEEAKLYLSERLGAVASAADGRYRLPHVDDRPLVAVVQHSRYLEARVPVPPAATALDVKLDRGASIIGTVTYAAGAAVAGSVEASGDRQSRSERIAPDGAFEIRGLKDGQYTVRVRPSRRGSRTPVLLPQKVIAIRATPVRVDFREPRQGVTVTVRVEAPAPNRGLAAGLVPSETALPATPEELFDVLAYSPQGERNGVFTFRLLPAGRYTLLVYRPAEGGVQVHRQVLDLPEEGERTLDVRLDPSAPVLRSATDSEEAPFVFGDPFE
ncbi:MAG: carboxypeptidase regulatory-like domain-containing protein [Myxococcales bacterium]|nr:carboxypeptidase regulatory-like domain-containing protein [Myxococcales bacterium]